MMASVENRSPLLDFRLHPFIFSGYNKKYHQCWNKYELRKAFDSFQPLPTQWRSQKQGFRWDGKHFMYQNRKQILELIESSDCLTGMVDTKKLVNIAHKFPKILKSSICKQSLCIAGIEHSFIKG
jgi:asparagine synthase (glutamine-hydrolysing)